MLISIFSLPIRPLDTFLLTLTIFCALNVLQLTTINYHDLAIEDSSPSLSQGHIEDAACSRKTQKVHLAGEGILHPISLPLNFLA